MFSEKEKTIYQDPVTQWFFDPLSVKRKLLIAGKGRLNPAFRDWNDASLTPEQRAAAEQVIVECGRFAFGLAPIDPKTGQGVPEAKVVMAVTAFTRWLRGKDEPVQSGPNSAPCTGCPQAAN